MQAQSTSELVLPTDSTGFIQLDVSAFEEGDSARFGYNELAVFVKNEVGEYGQVPVQGRFSYKASYVIFTPYFPFEKGLTYKVSTKLPNTNKYAHLEFTLEPNMVPEMANLLQVYPSGEMLPENLLRFYFYFNTPMKKEEAQMHIHLLDANGNVDNHAFMQFKQELWSPDGKRLTLLFDPGRIKRGVSTNVELGPALLEGNTYHLVVSGEWQDVYGQKLGTTETKTFKVGKGYHTAINMSDWNIVTPEAKSAQSLEIQFDRIMDHALIQSMIKIKNEENETIEGSWEMSESEFVVRFMPSDIWQKGHYHLLLNSGFEDVTGNNLDSLLDQPKTQQHLSKKTHYTTTFEIH